jgi:hypothetical protein
MESRPPQDGQAKSSLLRGLSIHPALALSGWAIGLLGLVATVYFYLKTIEQPGFSYYIDPTRTSLVAVGDASDIGITFHGQPLTAKSISTVQVVVWNAGKKPIKHEDVTETYSITLPHPIISAKILGAT